MASTPVFVGSAFAIPTTLIDAISTDRTGAGTYDTVHVGIPSVVQAIRFQAITQTIETTLMLFLDDGTNVGMIDEIRIRPSTPTNVEPGWTYLWVPPVAKLLLAVGDEIQAAMRGGSASLQAWTIGGNVT